ncbi:Putative peptidase S10, serine carboxypeptidase, alpha/Beta hydrolase [Septoria linicola]|uniref:Peptidase S10, serine carboxypeptidase, alpha/Beta hydrolase n=1 Tax=Septoria linicola TaxID=215465 RepID=A0A9Q9ARD8_9PEZI|nr:putative peptidase S10, serine carboxypeptidase, alpha/Beta hydrolase [Septoria linicola]USW53169.1 Putative peptidase S10, serine carboxypeptidase, alpha/Beta hydrolase [Septoria linicola]
MRSFLYINIIIALATYAFAGFPHAHEDVNTKQITGRTGSLSYRETTICETRAKAYAGYVHIPSTFLGTIDEGPEYNTSLFFWYFEARSNPSDAQTVIYLAGGPGISSMSAATQSGGPCTVLPDSNSTESNPWAWNEHVNMLYIDQPVGTGFSYDSFFNGTRDLLYTGSSDGDFYDITPLDDTSRLPAENATSRHGTFPVTSHTANTTAGAARTLWQFAQTWFTEFPGYKTTDIRISLWGHSYAGYFVPYSAAFFQEQNQKIHSGVLDAAILPLGTVGWTNGCTDMLYQTEWFPDMANNNTYDLKILPEEVYAASKEAWNTEGGCRDLILACREAGNAYAAGMHGSNEEVNQICLAASLYCATKIILEPWSLSTNRSAFDISHFGPDPAPPQYASGYFNQAWVQKELGVPLNFTAISYAVQDNFLYTADAFRAEGMKKIKYLLDQGVKVAMIYGDRDYRCSWNGAEKLSLAANWTGADDFRSAGYADIKIGDCGNNAGVVRQHGNLSFSRVFQAGHDVAYSQPRTAFEIFTRSMLGFDVATGRRMVDDSYTTEGPKDSWHIRNVLPPAPAAECNIFAVAQSCTAEQYAALFNGTAIVENTTVTWPTS